MNYDNLIAAAVGFGLGIVGGIAIMIYLLICSHRNFTEMCQATLKDELK